MGCGHVANYGHLPAVMACDELELHAVFDPSAEALARTRESFDIPHAYTDSAQFFESGIEAVTITSPAPFHRQNVLDAAKHQLPVLCEKPLAMNTKESEEMIAAMKAAGVSLYTAFCYRFSPTALKIRELVRENAIGDVRSLRLIYIWGMHGKYQTDSDGNRVIRARREGRMLEGGPMIDCGAHQIDLAKFWLNSEVISFTGRGAWVDEYEAPDHVWLHMDHANGAHTCVEISYSYHHTTKNLKKEFIYELIGTKGVIRYQTRDKLFHMETAEGSVDFEHHDEKSFYGLYGEWANALRTGSSDFLTTAEGGMEVVRIASSATEMSMQHRAVLYTS